jgi:hypothetical protein
MSSEHSFTRTRRPKLPLWLAAAATLTVGSGLFTVASAPAAQRHRAVSSGEVATPPGADESGTTAPGETPVTSPEAGTAPAAPVETVSTPPSETPARPSRPARTVERRSARRSGCRISIAVTPRRVIAGEAATAVGSLVCANAADAAEQTVTIYQRLARTHGLDVLATTTTEADGSYRLSTGALEGNSAFYAGAQGVRSARETVKVAARVSISGPPEGAQLLTAGRRFGSGARGSTGVTFIGTVSPEDSGARVVLQRQGMRGNAGWQRIGIGAVGADGGYSIAHAFTIPGNVNIRVVVRGRGAHLAGVSEPLSYEISQRQNPLLSIEASSDPILSGQSVTIAGAAAGAPNTPLTLLARTHGNAFAAVATTTTDAEGNYAFPAQSPLQTTFYRVKSATTSSAVLSEGVRPLLTAEASATSVPAGKALTFSGAVTPSHTGQTVYLERQNPSGVGFQVVEVGTVGAGSDYSISHTPFGAGTHVFRVLVAGNAENQAAISELFSIQVTPPPAAALEGEESGAGSPPAGEASS